MRQRPQQGFEQDFNNSDESLNSIDQVIVEPLREEQKQINMMRTTQNQGSRVVYQQDSIAPKYNSTVYNPGSIAYQPAVQQKHQPIPNIPVLKPQQMQQTQYKRQSVPYKQIEPVYENSQSNSSYQQERAKYSQSNMSYQNESFKNNSRIEAQPSQDLGLEYSGHKEQLKNTNVVEQKNQLINGGQIANSRSVKKYNGSQIFKIFSRNQKGEFVINNQIYDVLMNIEGCINLIIIGGLPLSGKSLLLNHMLKLNEASNFKDCKDGIWMNSVPIVQDNVNYFFLEQVGEQYSPISLMISSLYIYNILGEVEPDSLNQMTQIYQHMSKEQSIILSLPMLLILLRDNCPQEQVEEQIKQSAKFDQAFKKRKFTSLEIPNKEQDMSTFNTMKQSQLSREFLLGIQNLKSFILSAGPFKQLNGICMNGRMASTLIEEVTRQINFKVVDLVELQRLILEAESIEAYNQSLEVFISSLRTFFADDTPKEEFQMISRNIRDIVYERYRKMANMENKNPFYQKYLSMLDQQLDSKEKLAFQLNESMSMSYNQDILNQLTKDITSNLDSGVYKNLDRFIEDFATFLNTFESLGLGMEKCYSFTQFMIAYYPPLINKLINKFRKLNTIENDTNFDQREQQYQQQLNDLYEKETQIEEQIQKKEKYIIQLEQQVKKLINEQNDQEPKQQDLNANQSEQELKSALKKKDLELAQLAQTMKQMKQKKKGACFG